MFFLFFFFYRPLPRSWLLALLAINEIAQYLTQDEAIEIDNELMGPNFGFSVDQLMELAGIVLPGDP